MTTLTTQSITEKELNQTGKTRVPWRQRLVDMEQGIRRCLRNDSTIFVHLFLATLTFSAAFILNVPLLHWLVLVFCLMTILASELFHFALMETLDAIEANQNSPESIQSEDLEKNSESMEIKSNRYQNARTASTAAVMMTILLSSVLTGLIFYNQLRDFF